MAIGGSNNKGSTTSNSATSGSPTSVNAPTESVPAVTSAPVAGLTAKNPAPLGAQVTVAKGWNVKVNSAELDADDTMAALNQFNTPSQGKQYVLVNVSITNSSSVPGSMLFNLKLSLLPPSGVAIDSLSCFAQALSEIDVSAQLQPGATETGNLCFEASASDAASAVLLGEPQFTMDSVKDQRFFAIK